LDRLREDIEALAATPDQPKPKDTWDKAAIVSTFLGSVLIAAVGLVFTITYNSKEAERQQAFRDQQIRTAETDVVLKLLPQLTSENPEIRHVAETVLMTVEQTDAASGRSQRGGILGIFARLALTKSASPSERTKATAIVAAIAESQQVPTAERKEAANVVASVAAEVTAPKAARDIATETLSRISRVALADIPSIIASETLSRGVSEVILHHTGKPNATDYTGIATILDIGNYQLRERKWGRLGWHYAVAPDGVVWRGVPLDNPAAHLVKRNNDTVSILLILDGDKELPTPPQRQALGLLLRSLLNRIKIAPSENFGEGHGFHRDYDSSTTCPGKRLSKAAVLQWINEARAP
jgi:hypothetical protein